MQQVIQAIKKHKRFLVVAHVNPEGDSLCSQLAMKELLHILGKTAFIVNQDHVPEHYKFLPKADEISTDLKKKLDFDAVLILDCPTLKRIGAVKGLIPAGIPVVNIDHHISVTSTGSTRTPAPPARWSIGFIKRWRSRSRVRSRSASTSPFSPIPVISITTTRPA
jgi:phosphoesterase RecJ-like protein